ncbi:MAG: hypothetical protein NXI31_17835 [bacterium]|nr:hypothetical protein [bacterium]
MSAVSPDSRVNVDVTAAGAPSFVASTFDIDCPGVKRTRCNVNHHCPWPTPGARKGDEVKNARVVEDTKKYCTEDGEHFIGCSHVFEHVAFCAVPVE